MVLFQYVDENKVLSKEKEIKLVLHNKMFCWENKPTENLFMTNDMLQASIISRLC